MQKVHGNTELTIASQVRCTLWCVCGRWYIHNPTPYAHTLATTRVETGWNLHCDMKRAARAIDRRRRRVLLDRLWQGASKPFMLALLRIVGWWMCNVTLTMITHARPSSRSTIMIPSLYFSSSKRNSGHYSFSLRSMTPILTTSSFSNKGTV